VVVDTIPVSFIVDPLSIINISVDVNELALSMSSVILPLPFILGSIWPLLDSVAVSEPTNPLSVISSSSFESEGGPLFTFGVGVILSCFGHGFSAFVDGEVPRVGL
jgi:hypothetical protein